MRQPLPLQIIASSLPLLQGQGRPFSNFEQLHDFRMSSVKSYFLENNLLEYSRKLAKDLKSSLAGETWCQACGSTKGMSDSCKQMLRKNISSFTSS